MSPMTDEQKSELDERLKVFELDSKQGDSWDVVRRVAGMIEGDIAFICPHRTFYYKPLARALKSLLTPGERELYDHSEDGACFAQGVMLRL